MSVSVYLVFGDEYPAATRGRELAEAAVPPDERAFGLEVVDGAAETVEQAETALLKTMDAVRTPGFLAGRKVVWLQRATVFGDTVAGRSERARELVGRLVELIKAGLPPGVVLLITAGKVDKRFALYKACRAAGEVHEFALPEKPYLVQRYAEQQLAAQLVARQLAMAPDARRIFLDRVGADGRHMAMELDKLAAYRRGEKDIREADVNVLTSRSRESAGWDLADAFGDRDLPRALSVLRQLLFQGESPLGLMAGLESRWRDLTVFKLSAEQRWLSVGSSGSAQWRPVPPEIEQAFGEHFINDPRKTHPYRCGILARQAQNYTAGELRRCHQQMLDAHRSLVTSSLPPALTLEVLLVRTLGPSPAA